MPLAFYGTWILQKTNCLGIVRIDRPPVGHDDKPQWSARFQAGAVRSNPQSYPFQSKYLLRANGAR